MSHHLSGASRLTVHSLYVPLILLVIFSFACLGCNSTVEERSVKASATVELNLRQKINKMYQEYKAAGFAQIADMQPAELNALITDGMAIIIDARSEAERAVSMIPNAVSLSTFRQKKYAPDKTIVVYCTIGVRSAMTCMSLKADGIEAKNLAGGILNWTAWEFPLMNKGEETKRLHTYGERWALVPDNINATY